MKIILATIKGYNTSTATEDTLYFSDRAAEPVDISGTPIFFEPRITSITGVSRHIFSKGSISGRSTISGGEITIVNADGAYDHLNDWGFDDRLIVVQYGDLEIDGTFTEINAFRGVLEPPDIEMSSNESSITFRMKDKYKVLDAPIQDELFKGDNVGYIGLEGDENLKDRPKPLCFGECYNITPVIVNAPLLKYMVHNGQINEVMNVYDKGVALTYTAGSPGANEWAVDLSTGIITLGSKPDGAVTCDVKGAKPSGTYLSTVKEIVKEILVNYTDLTLSDLSSDFTSFAPTEVVGVYIDSERTVLDVVDELCDSIGAYCMFDANGFVRIGLIDSVRPDTFSIVVDETDAVMVDETGAILVDNDSTSYNDAAAVATIEDYEVLEISKYSGTDTAVPSYRLELSYAKNFTVQNESDLAGVVIEDIDRTNWLRQEYRKVIVESPNIKTVYKSSEKFEYVSSLVNAVTAQDVAIRLSRLYNVKRDFYSVALPLELAYTIDLNDVVVLKLNRFGMSNGLRFLVVGRSDFTPDTNQITLELWG